MTSNRGLSLGALSLVLSVGCFILTALLCSGWFNVHWALEAFVCSLVLVFQMLHATLATLMCLAAICFERHNAPADYANRIAWLLFIVAIAMLAFWGQFRVFYQE